MAEIGDVRRDLDAPAGKLTLHLRGEGAERLGVHGTFALIAADADRPVTLREPNLCPFVEIKSVLRGDDEETRDFPMCGAF